MPWSSNGVGPIERAMSGDSPVAATTAALDTYSSTHSIADGLMLAFRVAQELHEYAYSIHYLPHWRYVADAALPGLLEVR